MAQHQHHCPDCDTTGSAAGIRRHRSSAHTYPTRAEFIDRFFDTNGSGTAREVFIWLAREFPDGNWPYAGWTQRAISADLSQHKNYPSRWHISCVGYGPGAQWVRSGNAQPAPEPTTTDPSLGEDAPTIITRMETDLRRLRALLAA